MADEKLRVIPLGGLGEIGANMMVIEYGDDMIAIDAGLMFPEEEMLGVDLVIPNTTYIQENAHKLRAIFITHGHEDHTGALPYVLRQFKAPIYCTRLTRGLVAVKLREHGLANDTDLRVVQPGERIRAGEAFQVEFIHVAHSIPDAAALAIRTPVGVVIHTGDFKLDHTPVMGDPTDLPRLAAYGNEGVLLLMSDSTYAEVPGYTQSEIVVGEAMRRIMANAPGRVIIATFASLIARVQQIIEAAHDDGRRVFITGRSMLDNVTMAIDQGYLNVPPGTLVGINELRSIPQDRLVVITTGSQGEPTSALTRMARNDHQHIRIIEGDTVVLSASPIPGNEALIYRTVDNLFQLGAHVLYNRIADIHVRGHAAQEELKIILGLVRPRYFVPIHGEYRHMVLHARLAQSMGVPNDRTFIMLDGDVLELDAAEAAVVGRVPAEYVYVDGLGVGDISNVILRDRRHLANDGMVVLVIPIDKRTGKVVGQPDVISRGFVDEQASEDLLNRTRSAIIASLDGAESIAEWGIINTKVKETIAKLLYEETRRRPMVLPVVVEI